MVKEFVSAWDKNKNALEEFIKTHKQNEYDSYKTLVKLLFDIVINPERESYEQYNTENIHVIDDGSYQGTLLFVIPVDRYQPGLNDYVFTGVYYGSCSYCDTLQGIHSYDYDKLPDHEQVADYMSLCLHLLQRCHTMNDD
jgi:hypothetical protein